MALILGTNGDDIGKRLLWGTDFADQIFGFAGNDLIYGNGGDDTIHTGAGYDTVRAGSGNDTVRLESWWGDLDGGTGVDTLVLAYATTNQTVFDLGAGTGRIGYGGQFAVRNFENITTGSARDVVYGSEGRNVISTGDGHDSIYARGGDDIVNAGAGNDFVDAGAGNDTIIAGTGSDRFNGGAGYDTITYAASDGVVIDLIAGTATTAPGDVDTLLNIERFVGSNGTDRFVGGAAAADFFGGDGGDSFFSGAGANRIDGGAGDDWLHYVSSNLGVAVNLATGHAAGGHATGDVITGIENIMASNGHDQITGDGAANILYGLAGSDHISGGGGKDVLLGGAGKDFLTGGAGADTFYFGADAAGARDVIHDFQRGLDKIFLAMATEDQPGGSNSFARLTRYASPETSDGFTAGTINVRHEGQKTIVELNASDAVVYGRDPAEYSIELSGRLDLALSDFIL